MFYSNFDNAFRERWQRDDFVYPVFGWGHKQATDRIADLPVHVVEAGIGYDDTYAQYRIWESITDRHYHEGCSRAIRDLREQLDRLSQEVVDCEQNEYAKDLGIAILDQLRNFRWWEGWNPNLPDCGSAVIPNYWPPDDFEYCEDKEDYAFFIGRLGEHKGVHWAIKACEMTNTRLIIAGQGDLESICRDSLGYDGIPNFVTFIG